MKHLLLAFLILRAQVASVNPLVGLWESDVKSYGGIGGALEFRSDGTYTQATTVLVDVFYRVVRDRLVIGEQPPAVDADTRAAGTVSFRGNQWLMTGPEGTVISKERVGQAQEGVPPIVGVWRYQHPAGGVAFERYTADGRVSIRIPLALESGRFTLGEGAVVLAPDKGGPEVRWGVQRKENALTITDASSKVSGWHRVVEGAWYQIKK